MLHYSLDSGSEPNQFICCESSVKKSMQIVVREYGDGDHDDVMSVWERSSVLAHPFLPKNFVEKERCNISIVCLPIMETWVVEQEHHSVGFISLKRNEVKLLFVQPEFQRRGIGGALMKTVQDLYGDLEVEVFKTNTIGCAFYQKLGFEMVCEKIHALTGNEMLRMKFSAANARQSARIDLI
jgi:putative acetyltransferase